MHELRRTNDGVDRAGIAAMVTTDAGAFVDHGHGRDCRFGQRHDVFRKQARKPADRFVATRRTQVDGSDTVDDRLGIRPTAREAALGTLCLRQQVIDLFDKIAFGGRQASVGDREAHAR
jgi:hypothetical protein